MPIEFNCPGCNQRLKVADEHAGKQARCPQCQTVYTVPGAAVTQSFSSGPRFHLKTPDGMTYGPVVRSELDNWAAQGRVTAACTVREEGSVEWRPAATLYPQLTPVPQANVNPFSDAAVPTNPYASPRAVGGSYGHVQPHRGGLILAFGIISWVICPIFGLVAWLMGRGDLQQIRAGRMDPQGEGLTQAGTILGMIHCILVAVVMALYVGFIVLMVIIGAAGGFK